MDLVIDYAGKARYASTIQFDWFEVEWDAFFAERRGDYFPVTESYLEALRKRIEVQRSRSAGYSQEMLHRLELAERLLRELTPRTGEGQGSPVLTLCGFVSENKR